MRNYSEEKRIRPDILTAAVYWSIIIMMIYIIFSIRIFGDKGAGFSCGPIALYYSFYSVFVLAVQKAVWVMVRVRARRSQFLNARDNMRSAFRFFAVFGIAVAGTLFFVSVFFSDTIFGSSRGLIQGVIVAVSILFLSIQGVLRGYLQGIGYTRPIVISDLIISVVAFVSGILLTSAFHAYGVKANALFHINEFSAVYGSTGMMLGILIASIVGLIQIGISFYLRRGELDDVAKSGAARYLDSHNDVMSSVRPIIFLFAAPGFMMLFDQIFYVIHQRTIGSEADVVLNYGIYSGRVMTLITVFSLLVCLPFIKSWNRIMARVERDEFDGARERYASFFRKFILLDLPVAIMVFVLAEPLQVAFFGKTGALAVGLLRLASLMILLAPIATFASWMLNHMGKSILIVTNLTVAWAFHIGMVFVFEVVLKMGLYGILLAVIISVFVYDLLCLLMFFKMFKIRVDNMRMFVFPLACAAVMGLVCFFISLGLVNLIGDILTVAVCLVIGYVVYVAAITVMKLLNYNDLRAIPFGKAFSGLLYLLGSNEEYDE